MDIPPNGRRFRNNGKYSRSAPSRRAPLETLLLQCTGGGSSDSLSSSTSGDTHRMGQYQRIPHYHFCDICQRSRKDTHNLKCMHTTCGECMERYQIMKRGCRVCNYLAKTHETSTRSAINIAAGKPEEGSPRDMSPHIFFDTLDCTNSESRSLSLLHRLEHHALPWVLEHRRTVREEMSRLDKDCEIQARNIRQHVTELKEMMDRRAHDMISSINDSKRRHHLNLERQENFVDGMQQVVEATIDRCKEVTQQTPDHPDGQLQNSERDMMNAISLTQQIADERVHIRFHAYDQHCIPKILNSSPKDKKYSAEGLEGTPEVKERDVEDKCGDIEDKNVGKASKSNVGEKVEEKLTKQERMRRDVHQICGKVGVRVFIKPQMTVTLKNLLFVEGSTRTVCPINSTQAWVCFEDKVQLCSKLTGRTGRPIDVGEDVNDITVDRNGDALLACTNSVRHLTFDGLRTLFQSDNPAGIVQRSDGNLVIIEGKDLVVRDIEGTLIHMLNCDVALVLPIKLAINTNGDIIVSDSHSAQEHVLILDSEGKHRATIHPPGLSPRGVSCNHQGLIFVTDFRQDRIYLYTPNGQYLQTILGEIPNDTYRDGRQRGPRGPQSVVMDPSGDVWVGDWTRKVHVYSMKCVGTPRSSPSRASGHATTPP